MQISLNFQRKQLGQILLEMKSISEVVLDEALMEQRLSGNGERLGAILLRRGVIGAADYVKALACQHREIVATR